MGNLSWKFALTPQEMVCRAIPVIYILIHILSIQTLISYYSIVSFFQEILHVKRGWICYYWELAAKYGSEFLPSRKFLS